MLDLEAPVNAAPPLQRVTSVPSADEHARYVRRFVDPSGHVVAIGPAALCARVSQHFAERDVVLAPTDDAEFAETLALPPSGRGLASVPAAALAGGSFRVLSRWTSTALPAYFATNPGHAALVWVSCEAAADSLTLLEERLAPGTLIVCEGDAGEGVAQRTVPQWASSVSRRVTPVSHSTSASGWVLLD